MVCTLDTAAAHRHVVPAWLAQLTRGFTVVARAPGRLRRECLAAALVALLAAPVGAAAQPAALAAQEPSPVGGSSIAATRPGVVLNRQQERPSDDECRRSEISLGSGVSEFERLFGTVSFQSTNLGGRGARLQVTAQVGADAQTYSAGFTRPTLFGRNLILGVGGHVGVFSPDRGSVPHYTQQTSGGAVSLGVPFGRFNRLIVSYSLQRIAFTELTSAYCSAADTAANPFLRDLPSLPSGSCAPYLLQPVPGVNPVTGLPYTARTVNRSTADIITTITPGVVYDTLDQPTFPTEGLRLSASLDLAGFGGDVDFYRPTLEGAWYWRQTNRMSFGTRTQFAYLSSHGEGGTAVLPIYEKVYVGGDHGVRGPDFRFVGRKDPATALALGGNKLLLVSFEQHFTVAPAVRVTIFYDAAQVRGVGEGFSWKEDVTTRRLRFGQEQVLYNPFASVDLAAGLEAVTTSVWAFKRSLGIEMRFTFW